MVYTWPVSYTHLDVYKRQGLDGENVYNGCIREDFITFIDAYNAIQDKEGNENGVQLERKLTGEIVVNIVKELLLDVNNCVGIWTDSCSVMSSELVGAVCEIRREATHACWCPCLNHALNNSLSKSNNVASAVSYTHLDVYKRQIIFIFRIKLRMVCSGLKQA